MKKKTKVAFWIIFPLVMLIVTFLMFFYLDMTDGPLIIFTIEMIALVSYIVTRILLRHKKILFRLIPLFLLFVITSIILPFAHPVIKDFKALSIYSDNRPVMTLLDGKVKGLMTKDEKVEVYAGIPYAAPPVGDNRWKEPMDVTPWEGERDASYFASKSMQPESNALTSNLADLYASKGWYPDFSPGEEQPRSEDSLYLNIWKPHTDETNLPILIFIHGGSLTTGSSAYDNYNGEEMARKGVIMITITYRLGVFGYFAHEELINESINQTTGNYGLLDQIKALKWVNDNASSFGGDKNNITVAGESAGSSSVSALCTSPLAKGLFKRAIGESSSLITPLPPHTYRKMDEALEVGQNIMDEFKCHNIEELRKIPAKKLVKTKFTNSSMTLDGYALTKDPYDVYKDKENNEEALLNGFNVLEADAFVIPMFLTSPTNKSNIKGRLINEFGDEFGTRIYDLYQDKINKDAFSAFNEIISVYWFMQPHYSWSKMAKENNEVVYRYQFTKENKYHGTFHAGEMIYAYGNVKHEKRSYRYNESDLILSDKMLSYWSNYAKTGNPNQAGLEEWKQYEKNDTELMELGSHLGPKEDPYLSLYSLLEEYQIHKLSEDN